MAWCNPSHVVCMNFPCRTSETEYYQVQNGIQNILGPATFDILAVATYHVKQSGGSQAAVAYTSVGIALASPLWELSLTTSTYESNPKCNTYSMVMLKYK